MREKTSQGSASLPTVSGGGGGSVPTTPHELLQTKLTRYYRGISFDRLQGMKRELYTLYSQWGFEKVLGLQKRIHGPGFVMEDDHSTYVLVTNGGIWLLANWMMLELTAVKEMEYRVGNRCGSVETAMRATVEALSEGDSYVPDDPILNSLLLQLADGRELVFDDAELLDWKAKYVDRFVEVIP